MTPEPHADPIAGSAPEASTPRAHDARTWLVAHIDEAAQQVIDFIEADGVALAGKTVADIGSGDGLIDYGVFTKAKPAKLVGYDVRPTDTDTLQRLLASAGRDTVLPGPDELAFAESQTDHVPAPDDAFDVVFSWSVFEHVDQPIQMLREVRRILKPDGWFFLQLWPFFGSEHGGHLWQSVEGSFPHLLRSPFELNDFLRGKAATDPTRAADDEFRSLNRITLDGLQRAMMAAGLRVSKVQLLSETIHIPPQLSHLPLTDLAVSGIKLLAVPAS
ncbi:MAG TPA: class I SAM-dependent methyltransferase [Conexibacter sp.]